MRCCFVLVFFFLLQSPFSYSAYNKHQITYLMQAGEVEKSIGVYLRYKEELGKHDFEILQQMAYILLEQGARSVDMETQLLAIYGSGIANVASSLDILEAGVKSEHGETQLAAIQFLGSMQDDRSDELLVKAMSSKFFQARMEAALFLAGRKHKTSVGQIESLMYRIPPEARFFFPQFFALIGTSDAIAILRHLMEDHHTSVRVEALLSAARFGRDDLLPAVRRNITHVNIAEQEAAAFAVGVLKDSKSVKKLKRLHDNSPINVQIAAAKSLHILGDKQAQLFLISQAEKGNIFAIVALADIAEGKNVLAKLCCHPDLTIRVNAGLTLLKHKDPRCLGAIREILVKDISDMGLTPQVSIGKTMIAFKPVFSTTQQNSSFIDIKSVTLSVRQQILLDAMHLPERNFIAIARALFQGQQSDLIPTLTVLLENLQTPEVVQLLMEKSIQAGTPLIRSYCNLALYRMGKEGPYEKNLKKWIARNKNAAMIEFRPMVPMEKRMINSSYELTPEDNSRLLIESFQALSEKQHESSLNILLDSINKGNPKNRHVLAGLLLRTLQ